MPLRTGRRQAMHLITRAVLTVVLFAGLAFCVFGFLSSYELAQASARPPWQVGYSVGGAVCVLSMLLLWRRAKEMARRPWLSRRLPWHEWLVLLAILTVVGLMFRAGVHNKERRFQCSQKP